MVMKAKNSKKKKKKSSLPATSVVFQSPSDDDTIEITATKGLFANKDFPHARENCGLHPWKGTRSGRNPNPNPKPASMERHATGEDEPLPSVLLLRLRHACCRVSSMGGAFAGESCGASLAECEA